MKLQERLFSVMPSKSFLGMEVRFDDLKMLLSSKSDCGKRACHPAKGETETTALCEIKRFLFVSFRFVLLSYGDSPRLCSPNHRLESTSG